MAYDVRTPRSRGSLCGLALILLGGWAGVAPFAGPSFGFGFTPDVAWHYTAGRLYLSALPGAVVLLAGLIVALTASRWFGGFCAFVAALAGVWLIAGAALIGLLPASQVASITTGTPLGTGTSVHILTRIAFFAGPGALAVFFAALALGRFSVTALRDYDGLATDDVESAGLAGPGAAGYGMLQTGQSATAPQGYAGSPQYGSQYGSQYTSGGDLFQAGQHQASGQYPSATAQYPQPPGQYPPNDPSHTAPANPARDPSQGPFGLTQDWPTPSLGSHSQSPAPSTPYAGYSGVPGSAGQTAMPEPTTAIERPSGQQDPAPPGS